jgi:hypothetical protein
MSRQKLKWLVISGAHLFLSLVVPLTSSGQGAPQFQPGEIWADTDGQPIQAHGGGLLVHSNVYYWYGEDRTPGIHSAVSCYSSTNLLAWKRAGVALWETNVPSYYGSPTFVERPKVIFNPRTKKFVMWFHAEQPGYRYACAGVATSDTPAGPFVFQKSFRPIKQDFGFPENEPIAQKQYGATFRDMNLFVDDDGRAYVFYAADDNWTMFVTRLNAEFTGPELPAVENKTFARILVRDHREGPAPFKWHGQYYLITSACTGWTPNAASYATAKNILGSWKNFPNPCTGTNAATTFGGQSTFVLPMPGKPDSFIFMADRWNPWELSDSRYVWLPFTMKPDGTFSIPWRARWSF